MHRYEELEKIYYKKLFIKIFLFLSLIIIIIASFFFLKSKKNIKNKSEIKQTSVNKPVKKIKKQKKQYKPYKKEDKKIEIQELNFILPDIKTQKISQTQKHIQKKIYKKENETKKEIKNINLVENQANISQLISEYNKNHNYDIAIMIAKMYLKQNKLKQAQIWALRANSQDPSIPDSWIVMSDILIKEKNYKKAKEVLKVYINSYGSNDIIEEKLRSLNDK